MDNPYETKKDYVAYVGEKKYGYNDYSEEWRDLDEMELYVEGYHLILCSVTISAYNSANVGFRLSTLPPMREKTDNRIPVHFSTEPHNISDENLTTWSFHVVAYCRGLVKLQVLISDSRGGYKGFIWVNRIHSDANPGNNNIFVHKTICTMSAIPLCGAIEEKNNTTAPQPIGRSAFIPRAEEDIKKAVPKNPDKKPPTGSTSKL